MLARIGIARNGEDGLATGTVGDVSADEFLKPGGESDILATPAAGRAAIRGAILRVVGYGLGVGLSVIGAALLTRHLGPADFGRYTTVISLVTVLAALAEAGTTNIGVREFSVLPPGRREAFVGGIAGLRLVTTVAGGVIAVAFAAIVGYDDELVVGAAIVGLGLVIYAVQSSWSIPLQSRLQLGWVTVLELVRQAGSVALIALLVLAGASLVPFFWVTAVASLAALVVTIPLVRGHVPFAPAFRGTDWGRLLALTVPFSAANAVGAIYVYLAVVMLSLISTAQETGYFSASFRVFIVLAGIPALLVAAAFPILSRAARDDDSRLAYALRRLWEIHVLLGVGVALCTAVGAGLAIDVIAGDEFEPSVDVLRILSAALVASFLQAVLGFALLSLSRYRAILMANGAALIVSLTLNLALAPSYGAEGSAVATVAAESVLATVYGVALVRSRPDLRLPLGILPRVLVALLLASAVLLIPGLPAGVQLFAVGVVFSVTAFLLGAIPPEVGDALRPRRGG
jgi:O-antigen/teichoic acid export membrane protein